MADERLVEAVERLARATEELNAEVSGLRQGLLAAQATLIVLQDAFAVFAKLAGGEPMLGVRTLLSTHSVQPSSPLVEQAEDDLLALLDPIR